MSKGEPVSTLLPVHLFALPIAMHRDVNDHDITAGYANKEI